MTCPYQSSYTEEFAVTIERDNESNNLLKQTWLKDGVPHNSIGPAIIIYDSASGKIIEERWMRNGHTSRLEEEGPALVNYDAYSGIRVKEMFFADGNLHRMDGPAVIHRDSATGEVISEEFFQFNEPLSQSTQNSF